MAYRRGELSPSKIDRDFPHQVEIDGALVSRDCEAMDVFCRPLSVSPKTRSAYRRDQSQVRFCFAMPADAEAFQFRFGGMCVTVKRVDNRRTDDWGPLGELRNRR